MENSVLIVDDQPDNIKYISLLLKEMGLGEQIFSAPNGKIALEVLKEVTPDMIISDWEMPIMDGLTFLRELKKSPETEDIPFIMITAVKTDAESMKESFDAGVHDYIKKPFDKLEFVARVSATLKLQRAYLKIKKKNKEIEKQSYLIEKQKDELEQFAFIASHDLQEPLNTITNFIDVLIEDYSSNLDDVGQKSLRFINDSSLRMKKLITGILEYSRLGQSKSFNKVNCNKLIKELQEDLKDVIENTKARIHVANLPEVLGEELELRLLFQNLISNSIKFTNVEKTPEIYIDYSEHASSDNVDNKGTEFWEFSIRDNGIGIPNKKQDKIFEIFQRLHPRKKYEGTGIGLAHCKKIINAHGGKLWINSEEGKGSTFYFTLPK